MPDSGSRKIQLQLNLYGFGVGIEADSWIIERLHKDFNYFLAEASAPALIVQAYLSEPPEEVRPKGKPLLKTKNSLLYQMGTKRLNDYFGEALTIFDYKAETAIIYSKDRDLAHELTYLLILSRSGKWMDQKGLHKIHAFGLEWRGVTLIGMMSSGQGKTTHFLKLLAMISEARILSDDTPVIDERGNIHPFPLRVGVSLEHDLPDRIRQEEKYYLLRRKHYGLKYLFPMKETEREIISLPQDRVLLIHGKRGKFQTPSLKKVAPWMLIPALTYHFLIGVGLPLIKEYYLELTLRDCGEIGKIFFKRVLAMTNLLKKSECYEVQFSEDVDLNAKDLKSLMEKKFASHKD